MRMRGLKEEVALRKKGLPGVATHAYAWLEGDLLMYLLEQSEVATHANSFSE